MNEIFLFNLIIGIYNFLPGLMILLYWRAGAVYFPPASGLACVFESEYA